MIDKILYKFFAFIDSWSEWVEKQFEKPKKKKGKAKSDAWIRKRVKKK